MDVKKLAIIGAIALVIIGCILVAGCTSTPTENNSSEHATGYQPLDTSEHATGYQPLDTNEHATGYQPLDTNEHATGWVPISA